MKTVRTIRFSKEELDRVEEFLDQNPVFDFSRLVRLSVDRFLENPSLKLRPVKKSFRQTEKSR